MHSRSPLHSVFIHTQLESSAFSSHDERVSSVSASQCPSALGVASSHFLLVNQMVLMLMLLKNEAADCDMCIPGAWVPAPAGIAGGGLLGNCNTSPHSVYSPKVGTSRSP